MYACTALWLPLRFFKCAMKIKLIELIDSCSIQGKSLSWCRFKVTESRNVTKQQFFLLFFFLIQEQHIFSIFSPRGYKEAELDQRGIFPVTNL